MKLTFKILLWFNLIGNLIAQTLWTFSLPDSSTENQKFTTILMRGICGIIIVLSVGFLYLGEKDD